VIDRSSSHALDTIERQRARHRAGAQFATTTPAGGLLRVQAAPVLGPEPRRNENEVARPLAAVLLLSDVTETVEIR
jgi:hypothetical protein